MQYVHFSEKGSRINNEDYSSIADGMGGHSFGEVASETVCNAFANYWREHEDMADSFEKIEEAANGASMALDEKSGSNQMGTTLVMASIEGSTAHVAHAGDSRCYIIDIKGNVKYRTIDHIGHNSYINKAFFTHHPEDAIPEVNVVELQPLDRILLCTDGLYNAIDDETLLHTLQCAKAVEQVAEKYCAICADRADDNYTAIIIEI